MKTRIAYNICTGEIIEARTNKATFHKILTNATRADRQWVGSKYPRNPWVFRDPWADRDEADDPYFDPDEDYCSDEGFDPYEGLYTFDC